MRADDQVHRWQSKRVSRAAGASQGGRSLQVYRHLVKNSERSRSNQGKLAQDPEGLQTSDKDHAQN